MAQNYEYRFELKPGKHVFIPTDECIRNGKKTVEKLLTKWSPAPYFYHFHKRGGHVAAMRPHVSSTFKASADLTNFFPSVSRTRVHRALKSVGYSNRYTLDVASDACVEFGQRKFLPYGFVQSMALATLVVEKSLLGQKIEQIRNFGGIVTMYVDDILISGDDKEVVQGHFDEISKSALECGFSISPEKSSKVGESVNSFNCEIGNGEITVVDERMQRFIDDGLASGDETKAAILRYVGVLNAKQEKLLKDIYY